MTDIEMQKAWAFIKRKAFSPTNNNHQKWISTFNRFCIKKITGTPDIHHNKEVNRLDFKIIWIEPIISAKSSIKVCSLLDDVPTEINLHHDPTYKSEYPELPQLFRLSQVVNSEQDIVEVLRNFVCHPSVHCHLSNNKDFHEIRVVAGTNNFFYLMYQTFFQTLDYSNRYEDNSEKKNELHRLAKVLWDNKNSIHPISPGTLFPLREGK